MGSNIGSLDEMSICINKGKTDSLIRFEEHHGFAEPTKANQEILPLSFRFRKYMGFGISSILCFLMMTIQEQINVIFVGSLSDPAKLAGLGLGNMVLNLFPYAILTGVNTALETF